MSDTSDITRRSMSGGIAAGTLLFAIVLSIGTFLRMREWQPPLLILTCTLAFLALWWMTRYHLAHRLPTHRAESGVASNRPRVASWGAAVLAIVAWLLGLTGELAPISSSSVALVLLLGTGLSGLVSFMLAVIHISDPAVTGGKRLSIAAAAAVVGLVLVAAIRLLVA